MSDELENALEEMKKHAEAIEDKNRTIRMLVITVDELRSPLQHTPLHYLYQRATIMLNKLEEEGKI
jgi:hypothetical protein